MMRDSYRLPNVVVLPFLLEFGMCKVRDWNCLYGVFINAVFVHHRHT